MTPEEITKSYLRVGGIILPDADDAVISWAEAARCVPPEETPREDFVAFVRIRKDERKAEGKTGSFLLLRRDSDGKIVEISDEGVRGKTAGAAR